MCGWVCWGELGYLWGSEDREGPWPGCREGFGREKKRVSFMEVVLGLGVKVAEEERQTSGHLQFGK